jgi:hypothetical protein
MLLRNKQLSRAKYFALLGFVPFLFLVVFFVRAATASAGSSSSSAAHLWPVTSVDTMKYSRDLARAKLHDSSFDAVIDAQVKAIAATGATHVAIDTPYDDEFSPYLERWVAAARKYHLSVWYRGNWSGWESWFNYPKITRGEHLVKTENFILKNSILFEDGDVFTPCPECENGGPGDPRFTGDVDGFRQFLKDEYWVTSQAFQKIGKKVVSNYISMNGDVARLIMDKTTTAALGGVVTIDHYVASPGELVSDAADIAVRSGGRVAIGEFGVPIPDIQGQMTESEQARWLSDALGGLAKTPGIAAVNYWTSFSGTTSLWRDDGTPKPAVETLTSFYKPAVISGYVTDSLNQPIPKASVKTKYSEATTTTEGYFQLSVPQPTSQTLLVQAPGYKSQDLVIMNPSEELQIALQSQRQGVFLKIYEFFRSLFRKIFG